MDNANVLKDNEKQSDTTKLLDFEEVETSSADNEDVQRDPGCFPQMTLNHPAFRTLQLQYCEDVYNPGARTLQTVVTLNEEITPAAFEYILTFLYTGKAPQNNDCLQEIRRAAFLLGLHDLVLIITNLLNNEGYMNKDLRERFLEQRLERLREFTIKRSVLSGRNLSYLSVMKIPFHTPRSGEVGGHLQVAYEILGGRLGSCDITCRRTLS